MRTLCSEDKKNNKLYHGDISCSELKSHDIHIDADYSNWIAEVKLLATHKKNLIFCTNGAELHNTENQHKSKLTLINCSKPNPKIFLP